MSPAQPGYQSEHTNPCNGGLQLPFTHGHPQASLTTSDRLKEWAVGNGLELLTPSGLPTRRGEGGQRDSTVDLSWRNFMASVHNTFQHMIPDWDQLAHGSDHALIHMLTITECDAQAPKEAHSKAFDLDVKQEELELWQSTFKAHPHPHNMCCAPVGSRD